MLAWVVSCSWSCNAAGANTGCSGWNEADKGLAAAIGEPPNKNVKTLRARASTQTISARASKATLEGNNSSHSCYGIARRYCVTVDHVSHRPSTHPMLDRISWTANLIPRSRLKHLPFCQASSVSLCHLPSQHDSTQKIVAE